MNLRFRVVDNDTRRVVHDVEWLLTEQGILCTSEGFSYSPDDIYKVQHQVGNRKDRHSKQLWEGDVMLVHGEEWTIKWDSEISGLALVAGGQMIYLHEISDRGMEQIRNVLLKETNKCE